MDSIENRVEFHRWLDRCIADAMQKLKLENVEIITALAEELQQQVTVEYAERIRK